jgi:hypothetical protein
MGRRYGTQVKGEYMEITGERPMESKTKVKIRVEKTE